MSVSAERTELYNSI